MKAPLCRFCGQRHWLHQGHKERLNATNEAAEDTALAAQEGAGVAGEAGGGNAISVQPGGNGSAVVVHRTANRRTREKYNAYQRDYMRKRRGQT